MSDSNEFSDVEADQIRREFAAREEWYQAHDDREEALDAYRRAASKMPEVLELSAAADKIAEARRDFREFLKTEAKKLPDDVVGDDKPREGDFQDAYFSTERTKQWRACCANVELAVSNYHRMIEQLSEKAKELPEYRALLEVELRIQNAWITACAIERSGTGLSLRRDIPRFTTEDATPAENPVRREQGIAEKITGMDMNVPDAHPDVMRKGEPPVD